MGVHLAVRAAWYALAAVTATTAYGQILVDPAPPLLQWDGAAARQLAGEARTAAERARLMASERTGPGHHAQGVALADLTALAAAARRFADQLEQAPEAADHSRAAYQEMVKLYRRTQASILEAGYDASVMQDFNRIGPMLDRVAIVYTQRWRPEVVHAAAGALAESVARAGQLARSHAPSESPAARRTLFLIQRLEAGADFFHRQVDLGQDPGLTDEDFRVLVEDYGRVLRSLSASGLELTVRDELARAGLALRDLSREYQVAWNHTNARSLARQLRSAAGHVLEAAGSAAQEADPAQARTLNQLSLLAQTAEQLDRRVEIRASPAYSRQAFLALLAAYDQAGLSLAEAGTANRVLDEFSRLAEPLNQLNRMYSGTLDAGPGRLSGTVTGP